MRGGIRAFPRANPGVACAEGNDDKLSLRIVYMDHPVINCDEYQEGHGSSLVIEDCKVWWAASVVFKLEAGGERDNHVGRRVLGRRKRT